MQISGIFYKLKLPNLNGGLFAVLGLLVCCFVPGGAYALGSDFEPELPDIPIGKFCCTRADGSTCYGNAYQTCDEACPECSGGTDSDLYCCTTDDGEACYRSSEMESCLVKCRECSGFEPVVPSEINCCPLVYDCSASSSAMCRTRCPLCNDRECCDGCTAPAGESCAAACGTTCCPPPTVSEQSWIPQPGEKYETRITSRTYIGGEPPTISTVSRQICSITREYRCRAGFYGAATENEEPTCTSCPSYSDSLGSHTGNSLPGTNGTVFGCFVGEDDSFRDDLGHTYTYTPSCHYGVAVMSPVEM